MTTIGPAYNGPWTGGKGNTGTGGTKSNGPPAEQIQNGQNLTQIGGGKYPYATPERLAEMEVIRQNRPAFDPNVLQGQTIPNMQQGGGSTMPGGAGPIPTSGNRQDEAAKNWVPGSWNPNDPLNAIRDDFISRDQNTGRPLTQAEINQNFRDGQARIQAAGGPQGYLAQLQSGTPPPSQQRLAAEVTNQQPGGTGPNQAQLLGAMFPGDTVGGPDMARAALAMRGQAGRDPETAGLPVGPNGNVDWSAVQNQPRGGGAPADTDSAASPADFSADASRMEEATFGRMRNLLEPGFQDQQRQLENRLAVQGLPTGGEAYGRAYDVFNRSKNNAYENAALSAVGAGRAEQGRMFGQQMDYTRLASALMGQDAALQNQARQQGLQEALLERQLPQNELAAMLGVMPATPFPQFQQQGGFGMQAPDVMGAYNAAANRDAASQNAMMSGILGIGGAALGAGLMPGGFLMSSRQFKEPVGDVDAASMLKAVQDMPVERWRYKGETKPHIGPYAEDFKEATGLGDGTIIEVVDALGVLMAAVKSLAERLEKLEKVSG